MKKLLFCLVLFVLFAPLEAFPQQDAVDLYNQGVDALKQGHLEDAIALFTHSLQLDPQDHLAYNNRGIAYKRKGLFDKAIEDYNRALEIKPDYTFALANRGNARYRKGDLDGALSDLTAALKQGKKDSILHTTLGLVRKDKGELDQAIKDLRQGISLNKKNVRAYQGLGEIYEQQKDYDRALDAYLKAVDLAGGRGRLPDIEPRIANLRKVYAEELHRQGLQDYREGKEKQALQLWTQALKFDPDFVPALRDRGLTYHKSGKHQRSKRTRQMLKFIE